MTMQRLVYAIRIKDSEQYVTSEWRLTVSSLRRARIFNQANHARSSRHFDEGKMDVVPFMLVELPLDFKPSKPVKVRSDLIKVLESTL